MNPTLKKSLVSAWKFTLLAALLTSPLAHAQTIPGAEGFGAATVGGNAGPIIYVTSLSDANPSSPAPGTLRWAVNQSGPRRIKFQVAGTIALKDHLRIQNPNVTIDGSDAPGDGICLKDYSVIIDETSQVILRYIRIRRGDVELLKYLDANGLYRPTSSTGLDCVSIDESQNVLIDHCSLSWSCDEIFGITRSQNVTIQWCIIAEPLTNPRIHPYGDNHAFGLNISSSTLSLHHNLITRYVYRGPQFEANDNSANQGYTVKMEAVNNLIVNYESSGSRYSAGIETGEGIAMNFHFVKNRYLNPNADQPDIHVITKHGTTTFVKTYVLGNIGPNRPNDTLNQWAGVFLDDSGDTPINSAPSQYQNQKSSTPLFTAPVTVTTQNADSIYDLILDNAGANISRDTADARVVAEVRNNSYFAPVHSQNDVGGWPVLSPGNVPPYAPSGLVATASSSTQINLNWTDNSANESGFRIQSSPNGTTWTDLATVGANVTTYPHTGLTASTTYYYRVDATNAYGNSAYSNTANATTHAASSLPSPWVQQDIGSVGIAGSGSYSNGTFTVTGSGDLKGSEDRFRYVYQVATGDCEIKARVVSVQNNDSDAAAGVMIRDDLNDNCKMAAMLITASNGAKARRRTSTGGDTIDTTIELSAPEWVRVQRTGDSFKFYRSGNGTSWTLEKTVTITMGSTVRIGLAVTSDDNSETCTATFTNVTATP
jgi:regulation of enolase protein 1 (concanavalin A-like superfamily)